MKKILLIEDRHERQALFMNHTKIDLEAYGDILENKIVQAYDIIYEKLKEKCFDFRDYALIIAHKNAFNGDTQDIRYLLENQCMKHEIPLVFFSGGITSNYYEASKNFIKLELNSKDFYSKNLKLFLENYKNHGEIELLMLSYGEQWRLDILLNTIEKINYFIALREEEKEYDVLYEEFVNITNFNFFESLNISYSQPIIENGWVYLEELKVLADSIDNYIKESLIYEK